MKKQTVDKIIFFLARLALVQIAFWFWYSFLVWGLGYRTLGTAVAGFSAMLTIIITIPKRDKCENANTRRVGTPAADRRKNANFTRLNESRCNACVRTTNPARK